MENVCIQKIRLEVFAMKRKKLIQRLISAGILNSLALLLVVQSANQACIWFFHQPKFPESGNKFKRH